MVAVSRVTFIQALLASSSVPLPSPSPSSSVFNPTSHQQESEYYKYDQAAKFVRDEITQIIQNQDPTLAGSILRLAFHDATVRSIASDPSNGGADGSIRFELDWSENRGLSKPLSVVSEVFLMQQQMFDGTCPASRISSEKDVVLLCQSLSFADTLALSGAAAVEAAKGPRVLIHLGREDMNHSDNRHLDHEIVSIGERSSIRTSLPSAGLDSLGLRNYFKRLGLTEEEMVALSGAHDLGRHVTLTGMSRDCLRNLTRSCLENAPVLAPFISAAPDTLSNTYFQTLLRWNDRKIEYGEAAFIPTDVALVVDDRLRKHVIAFAKDEKLFFRRFTSAYQKLVDSTATTESRF